MSAGNKQEPGKVMTILPTMLFNGARKRSHTLILAHGAGAAMDSPFMVAFGEGLAAAGLCVGRFEFPYMQRRRAEGGRRPPDRAPKLLDAWAEVIDAVRDSMPKDGKLIIGGKSMGGRMASLVADDKCVDGLVCLGYPFHPSGKPEKTRTEHLLDLKTPTLIAQGTRDALGGTEAVQGYSLSKSIRLLWLEDGDHSFKPRKKSGRSEEQNWSEAIAEVATFVKSI
jgi:uncharacterized protein